MMMMMMMMIIIIFVTRMEFDDRVQNILHSFTKFICATRILLPFVVFELDFGVLSHVGRESSSLSFDQWKGAPIETATCYVVTY